MANTNKQWKAEDIEKIWNNTGNGAQAKSAPLPVLNSKSQSSNSYKIKPYENKEYTAQDIEKVWRNVERGKQMQSEMKSKATSAPAKNTKVPTREESLKSKYDAVKNIDTRNVDRKTEADIKKISRTYNANEKKYGKGNIDLTNRPQYVNEDGSISTVRSMSFNEDGKEILVPTIAYDKNGKAIRLSDDEAIKRYHDTGEYLGKFDSVKEANDYAEKLHNDQANMLNNKKEKSATKPSTRYSNQTAGQIKEKSERKATYDNDFAEYWEYTRDKADFNDYDAATDTAVPHWQNVKKNIMQKYDWDEREFKTHWKAYEKVRSTNEANEEVESMVNLAKEHPVLATIAQQALLPQTTLEGATTVAGAFLGASNPDYLANSPDDPRFTGTRVREAVKQTVRDNSTKGGRIAYNILGSLLDMGENAILSGGTPALMGLETGLQSAARNQMTALERGADPLNAANYGLFAGTTSGIMNSIGLDKAMGAAAKTAKGAVAKGAATEGLENLVEDAANLTLDAFINKNKSQLNSLHDYYVSQNMSDEDAWKNVMKDTGLDLLTSTLSGAMFGGLVRGAKNLPELATELKGDIGNIAGKVRSLPMLNKITDENVNNSSLGDVDNVMNGQYNNVTGGIANGETADVGTENQGSVRPEESIPAGAEVSGNVDEKRTYTAKDGRTLGIRDVVDEKTSKLMDDAAKNYRDKLLEQPNEVASSMPENNAELDDYTARRNALIDAQQGMSMKEMVDSVNQLKAMDTEMAETHPEWFRDGKFVGNEVTQDFSNEMEDITEPTQAENVPADSNVPEAEVTNPDVKTSNALDMNLQFFAALSEEKKQLQVQLTKKGLALSEKRAINDQINEIDNELKGLRKTITNTAVKAGIVTEEQIANDPELKAIAEYVRHSNAKTVEQAQQNLAKNGEEIKNNYISGKTQIKTDLDADQAMQLLQNRDNPLDDFERNAILKNLATNGTEAGQFIQALKKYSNTAQGAFISATKVINNETEHWAKNHKQAVGINGKLAEALKRQGYDGTVDITKPRPTFEQLREQVANTLAEEYSSIENQFSDSDIDYLAHMLDHNVSIDDLVDALNTKMATGRFGISDETQARVNELFEESKNFDENSQDYVERQAEAFRLLAEEVAPSATPLEKFDAWRYMAMLGNPKTMLRNFIGNKMFGAVTGVADNFAALVEGGVDRASKAILGKENGGIQRTKAILNPVKDKALLDATLNDAYAKRFRQIEGSKYEKMDKDALSRNRSVFNSKLMRLAEKAVDKGISDTKAVAKKYSTSMAGYMKANGITEQDLKDSYEFDRLNRSKSLLSKEETARLEDLRETAERVDKARDYALKQAEYATFHEDNAIADILSSASRKNMGLRVLVEGLVPFKKTPANIVKSGIEFSPLGAVKSIAQTGKLIYENTGSRKINLGDTYSVKNPLTHGNKDVDRTLASDIIQSWGRTLTGSALASLGYYLYNKGILHSSSKDEKYQDDLEGKQNYSIEINGKTYSIDWAVPAAMPLLLGAEVKKAFDENAILDEKWYKSPDRMFSTLSALFEPVIETSMLQGVENSLSQMTNRFDDSSKFEKAANVAASLGANYLSQTIPTLSGQIARTVDNTRRATDTNSEGLLIPSLEKQGRKVLNKIPFASKYNNPYVDARGEQQKNAPYDNPLARLAYQTLSPWYAQDIDTRDSDRIAREAYNGLDENGKPIRNADVFADWKSNVKMNGEKLDVDQMYQYRTAAGQANTEAREALAKEDWFNNASPAIRTEVLRGLNTMADHIGKNAVDPTYGKENDYFEAYMNGGTPALLETIKADIEKKQQKKQLDDAGLPSNDVTKALIDNNNTAGQQKYKDALAVAKNYGYDSITKEEYQIFDKKGGVALSNQLKYKKEAEALDVPNSEEFRKAVSNGTAKAYAQTYKAIKSTKVGEDDLGNNKYLEYNDTTAKIYKDKNQQGLNEYVLVKKNMPEGSSKDSDYITALKKTSIPESDKAYFFVLHKGKDIAKSAPKGDENIYMWYQAKDKFDSNKNGSLSKEEKAALYKNVYNYLRSLGYSDSQAKAAQKWTWK